MFPAQNSTWYITKLSASFWWSESDKCTNNKALIFPLLLLAADHNHCRDGRWAKILVWTYGDKFVVLVVVLSASVIWCLVEVKFTSCCGLPLSPRFRDPKSIVNKRRCASLWLVSNFECVLVKSQSCFPQSKYSVLDWLVHYLVRAFFRYKVFWHLSNEKPSCIYNKRCRLTLHITFGDVLISSTAASSVDAPSFNSSTTEVKTAVDRPFFGYHDT